MKIGAAFPSNYLKKEDCGNGIIVTVKDIRVEDVGGNGDPQDSKPVVHFHESDKGMVINRTNAEIMTQVMGTDDTDGWIGKQIVLYNEPNIWFGSKQTGGIRVRPATGQPAPQVPGQAPSVSTSVVPPGTPQAAPPTFKSAPAPAGNPAFDDDIPFN
jgi:hypothetical protein